jgi:hypothetical protein
LSFHTLTSLNYNYTPSFKINDEELEASLPEDKPVSFWLLAQQCISFEGGERPMAVEVVDWLEDLYGTIEDDPQGIPKMRPITGDFTAEAPTILEAAASATLPPNALSSLEDSANVDAFLTKFPKEEPPEDDLEAILGMKKPKTTRTGLIYDITAFSGIK